MKRNLEQIDVLTLTAKRSADLLSMVMHWSENNKMGIPDDVAGTLDVIDVQISIIQGVVEELNKSL